VDDEILLFSRAHTPRPQNIRTNPRVALFSRAHTPRPQNIRTNPRVAANFDSDGDGGDVVSIEGEARIAREKTAAADVPPTYVEKYAAKLAASGWTMASMLVDYPVEIRIRPTRIRAW